MAGTLNVCEVLSVLPPDAIPSDHALAAWMALNPAAGMSHVAFSHALADSREITNLEAMESLAPLLRSIEPVETAADLSQSQADDLAHDSYFHVHRVNGSAPAVFLRMAVSARLILHREIHETPFSFAHPLLESMDRAFADLTASVCGTGGNSTAFVTTWKTRPALSNPMVRWVRGHQIFAALSQGLIFSFLSMSRATREGRGDDVRRWADLSTTLLRASGAAFVLTGDFSPEDYMSTVRPSMMPPASAVNLSGLMSIDHRVLVQTMRDMKPVFKALHEHEPERHDRMQQEMRTMYDRHIHVCERFVGERPSLLTERHAKKSGPALIEQFKTLRMKIFDTHAHVAKLKPTVKTETTDGRSGQVCPVAPAAETSGSKGCKKDL